MLSREIQTDAILNRPAWVRSFFASMGDVSEEMRQRILSLTVNNYLRFQFFAKELLMKSLLKEESVDILLTKLAISIPNVSESIVKKVKMRPRSEYQLTSAHSFFMSPGVSRNHRYAGNQGIVNPGYANAESIHPTHGMKRYAPFRSKAHATREARYIAFLQRGETCWYSHPNVRKGCVLVFPWAHGSTLNMVAVETFRAVPLIRRFSWLATLFMELDKLHANFRIHGDINITNVVLDLEHDQLRLIDFATAHKVLSKKSFASTPLYEEQDDNHVPNLFRSDMYQVFFLVAKIFPELFYVDWRDVEYQKINDLTVQETAAVRLINSLRTRQPNRCTSQQALQYCEAIVNAGDQLNEKDLNIILAATIQREALTVEDVLRSAIRFK
jgi:hypothetical protein